MEPYLDRMLLPVDPADIVPPEEQGDLMLIYPRDLTAETNGDWARLCQRTIVLEKAVDGLLRRAGVADGLDHILTPSDAGYEISSEQGFGTAQVFTQERRNVDQGIVGTSVRFGRIPIGPKVEQGDNDKIEGYPQASLEVNADSTELDYVSVSVQRWLHTNRGTFVSPAPVCDFRFAPRFDDNLKWPLLYAAADRLNPNPVMIRPDSPTWRLGEHALQQTIWAIGA
jgi:hypothetical protein